MMKKKLFYSIFLLMILFSCERMIDNYWKEQERKNYTSPYMGTWTGTYTGDERGTFTLEVGKSGYMKRVTRTSGTFYEEQSMGCVLHDGTLQQVYSGDSKFMIQGSLRFGKCEWKKEGQRGTWVATRR